METATTSYVRLPHRKLSPRAEYRLREGQRVKDSVTLGSKYPELKSLTVELAYSDREEVGRGSSMKYEVNLEHAKSVLRFDCQNTSCVCGDFDLTSALDEAVAARNAIATGELTCQGWRDKTAINTERCLNFLRYKLSLQFTPRSRSASRR